MDQPFSVKSSRFSTIVGLSIDKALHNQDLAY
jgi:hypothetical protein